MKDWSQIDWKYDDEGYIICPSCYESMNAGGENEPRNHSPDCEYILYIQNRLKK
jgi:hypothetical protein